MQNSPLSGQRFFTFACIFEASLTLVALILGGLFDVQPLADLHITEQAFGLGVMLTLPMLLLFLLMQQLPYPPLQKIKRLLQQSLAEPLHKRHWTDLLILAILAGFSEEVLFRGLLQPWLEQSMTLEAAWLVSNVVFALLHAVTPLYFVLAMLMGLYLGECLDYGGQRNLLMPIVVHALYDFGAFIVILRDYRKSL